MPDTVKFDVFSRSSSALEIPIMISNSLSLSISFLEDLKVLIEFLNVVFVKAMESFI